MILVIFYLWGNSRRPARGNPSPDTTLWVLGQYPAFLPPAFPSGCTLRAVAVGDGFMVLTALFMEVAGDILRPQLHDLVTWVPWASFFSPE